MKVNIIYLPYRRFHYSEVLIKILSKVKSRDFHVTVCGMNQHRDECKNISDKLGAFGISANAFNVTTGESNYLDKLRGTINSGCEYTIKLDEDIFLGPAVWDFWINNLDILNDSSNGLLSPTVSNGIPTCDEFVFHMDDVGKTEMNRLFSATSIPSLWGANYSTLNNLLRTHGYNSNSFYQAVSKINHHYRGIHPIRVSVESQLFLNQWITDHFDDFFFERDYTIKELPGPYICNSVFAMKTESYHNVLHDESLYKDCFDEVALNNYIDRHHKKKLFISNSFGIHTMYNTLYGEIERNKAAFLQDKEEEFYQFIKQKVSEKL